MTPDIVIQIAAIVLGSNWLGQILTEIYKNKKKKKTPSEIILKHLAGDHLLVIAEKCKEQGFVPSDEYNDLFEEYKAYRDLEGNGRVEREYGEDGELRKLPVR